MLRAFQGPYKFKSARQLTEYLNLQDAFGGGHVASQGTVLNVLKRWAPDWRTIMERNKYGV